jgi:hypothetical protein
MNFAVRLFRGSYSLTYQMHDGMITSHITHHSLVIEDRSFPVTEGSILSQDDLAVFAVREHRRLVKDAAANHVWRKAV